MKQQPCLFGVRLTDSLCFVFLTSAVFRDLVPQTVFLLLGVEVGFHRQKELSGHSVVVKVKKEK